jgi:hypothetical protein
MSEEVFAYDVDVELSADGKVLGMNEFVRTIFEGVIKGMVSALRIPEGTEKITIKVELTR